MKLQYEAPVSTKKTLLKRGLAAGLAVAGTAAVTLGMYGYHAETFHHDAGRLLAEIANAKSVQVTFRPSADSSSAPSGGVIEGFLFPKTNADGSLGFDGRISYEHVGSQYNFTLLNDKGFVTVEDLTTHKLTRAECLTKDATPPFSLLTDGLKDARVIDAVANPQFNVKCASGKLVEFVFADEPYVFCSSASTSDIAVTGEDISASVKLLQENTEGAPTLASLTVPSTVSLSKCEILTDVAAPGNAALPVARKLTQRAKDAYQVATGGRRLGAMGSTTCGCTDGLKKCLFVHGLGYNDTASTTSFKEYFGTIEQQAKCCSSVEFLHIDTLNAPWYDETSNDKVCSHAAALSTGTDKMKIENVAIVAHSMGNLVTNSAFMKGKCGLAKSSKYIALNGPMMGTMASTSAISIFSKLPTALVQRLCTNDPNTKIDDPIVNTLLFFGLCPTRLALQSLVFKGSAASNAELDALFTSVGTQFQKSVTSSLCGVNPVGLLTTDSIQLSLLGVASNHASLENDGQVHYDSCRGALDKSLYSTSWNGGKYYKANINHLDGTFRNGDGWWGNDRKPIKWFNCQF